MLPGLLQATNWNVSIGTVDGAADGGSYGQKDMDSDSGDCGCGWEPKFTMKGSLLAVWMLSKMDIDQSPEVNMLDVLCALVLATYF
jgi:hypothetical protein